MNKITDQQQKKSIRLIAVLMISTIAIVILLLYGCGTPKVINKGYLVSIDSNRKSDIMRFSSSVIVDSLVNSTFGYALKGFTADSVFKYDNSFMIGTESNFIYVEEKNRVEKANGKIKFKTIKK